MKISVVKFKISLLTLLCIIALHSVAQDVYEVNTQYPVHEVDDYLKVYIDSSENFTIQQILEDTSNTYVKGTDLPGYLRGIKLIWGKLELHTIDSLEGWTLHFRDIAISGPAWVKCNGKVDVYAYADEELIFHKKTGYGYNRKERDIGKNWVLQRVSLDDFPINTPVTLIIRVEASRFGYPPFFRLNLRGPSQPYYHEIFQFNNSFYIFMFGVTFIILLYHILQYLYLRDIIFLYFSIWVFFCCMTFLMSVGGVLDSVHKYGFVFWMFFSNSVYFLFWFFGRSFIQSKKKFPLLDKFIIALAALMIVEILIVLFLVLFTTASPTFLSVGYHTEINVFINIMGLILSIAIATRRDNFARYFGIGAIIGLIFLVIGSVWAVGWIRFPGFEPHSWGMFAQIVIFSFGIAYRRQVLMKQYNEEKLAAQMDKAEFNRIKDLDEIKTKFFTNLSHEFRTPLSLILGPLNQAKKSIQAHSINSENSISLNAKTVSILYRNAERLQNLVDQLLDLSKIESGKLKLDLTKGNIIGFIRAVVFSFESMAERQNISLNTNFPKGISDAHYDKDKLEKILSNLLSNAFKYTRDRGAVSVIVKSDSDYISIEVSDTGMGIDENEVKHIFDRFYRVEGSEEKGSGIGLALTKELVELLNGQINVNSTKGQGTTFKVRLPLKLNILSGSVESKVENFNDVFVDERKSTLINGSTDVISSNTMKTQNLPLALVVEDNEDLRVYISEVIGNHYKVIVANDGLQGERIAFEHIPDVIISDVMMPKKDGFEMCQTLKSNVKTSHIPIIMLTAKAGHDNKMAGLTQGADAYLTKPFDDEELLLRMQNLIDSRKKIWDYLKSSDLLLLEDLPVGAVDDSFLRSVMAVIKENLDNEYLSVDDIAKKVGFSKAQLYRKLKALCNKSTNQLIIEIRLNEAKRMLESNEGNVSEVAYSVGYSNMSYFTKSFKEKFGMLPSKV